MKQVKVVVERHSDGYAASPLGMVGTVIGAGDTREDALAGVKSATAFHVETFGSRVLEDVTPILGASIAELGVAA